MKLKADVLQGTVYNKLFSYEVIQVVIQVVIDVLFIILIPVYVTPLFYHFI